VNKTGKIISGAGAGVGVLVIGIAIGSAGNHTTVKTVAGPVVTKTVPGPARTVIKKVPGPTKTVYKTVPAAPSPQDTIAGSSSSGDTVTFVVYGNCDPQVTYGSGGSNSNGYAGMSKTENIPSPPPSYYDISAQCQQNGSASVLIRINGKQLSSGVANGAYNIASAQVGQDLITGQWMDENS
jgi:hypothetical protein